MDKLKKILLFILSIIWQLPQNLIAIFILPFIGKLKLITYKNYCFIFEATKMNGSISLGNFILLCPTHAKSETTIAHELGHVWWSHLLGPLYLIIIGVPSICWATFRNSEKYPCYYSFYTERIANEKGGVIAIPLPSGKGCYLIFKNKS